MSDRPVDRSEHHGDDALAGAPEPPAQRRAAEGLREEVGALRRRLAETPARTRALEERAAELERQLSASTAQNDRLVRTLTEARARLVDLKSEVDRLAQPPSGYATFLEAFDDGTADVVQAGRKVRVAVSPAVEVSELGHGQEVLLNEALNVVRAGGYDRIGEVVTLKEVLDGGRALVTAQADEERVVRLAAPLQAAKLRVGDALNLDPRSSVVFEKVPKAEVESLLLEEVPDIEYTDIGGLTGQIEAIRDAVELPFAHPELYREHGLKAPKGILLYGPPGCGKTLIAKAVARSLSRQAAERQGKAEVRSYFLNIKGPELLNKYVGETERHIRLIFARAREKASEGTPVIVFFDEMESLFRTRGSGVSSDTETTIVPQLLAEIDGVERLDNVIVIGASNREDMIDPAILRPGRLDVKIKIERPDAQAAHDVFAKYLTPDLPLHADDLAAHGGSPTATAAAMIERTVLRMYAETEENQFLEVTYANGDKEVLYFKDFNSGAMIQNIVDRAKKSAIKDLLTTGQRGIRIEHLMAACVDEFKENEDLPNTTNPDDWARISGKKGERITYIRTIVQGKQGSEPGRSIDTVTGGTGQYL
ncbi:proteasome ATPase [Quadrisphaera sp. INWT6]|uniref:proteasome ATPase n=1 Tax=Quadrisphaera sp. INWT6 TaxID=2596917 RepID=UPI0018922EE1|nr:proteasome ATPase [Quadrisphaera sp. INWT6]MBF5082903.1 proteasome ATPase [Quadrisphaera sp. INWT6]